MRPNAWLLLVLSCAWPGCAPKPPGETTPAATPRPPERKAVSWPQVEGFERGEVRSFDDPRLGYSVAYNSAAGLAATVFVYGGGFADIPEGASDITRAELLKASSDVIEAKRRGMWKSVEGGQPRQARLGGRPNSLAAWAASFRLGHAEGEALSDIYVTGRRGEFVKVRCTYPAERQAECERDRARLLDALDEALGR